MPSVAEAIGLCDSELLSGAPAAAFCSGVLVERDLVLTAAHCVHRLPPADFSIVFGYYFSSDRTVSIEGADVFPVDAVVSEAHDPPGAMIRYDYAWVRLNREVDPARTPAPIRRELHISEGSELVAMVEDGAVILMPRSVAKARLRAMFASVEVNLVDELIADRRRAALDEDRR